MSNNNTKNWLPIWPEKYSEDFLKKLMETHRLPDQFMKIHSYTDNDYTDYTDYFMKKKNNTLKKFDKLEHLLDNLDSVLHDLSNYIKEFQEERKYENIIDRSILWEYRDAVDNIKVYRNTMKEMKINLVDNNKFSHTDIMFLNSCCKSASKSYKKLLPVLENIHK